MSKWISISDRLPPNDIRVFVAKFDQRKNVNMYFTEIYKRFNDEWVDENEKMLEPKYGSITHWMPLPDAPDKIGMSKEDVLDEAWLQTMDNIKVSVKENLSSEDIKYEFWLAVSQGVKEFINEEVGGKYLEGVIGEKIQDALEYAECSIKFK